VKKEIQTIIKNQTEKLELKNKRTEIKSFTESFENRLDKEEE
jgi:hypothetical protein